MGFLPQKPKMAEICSRRQLAKVGRFGVALIVLFGVLAQGCQTLEQLLGPETRSEDHGLYASGTIDGRPARAKLAVDTSTRWTLPPDARAHAEAILGQLSSTGESFGDWVKPLLISYLPEGQSVDTVIVIDVGLAEAILVDMTLDQVTVDASAAMFAGKAQLLLSYARHEMVGIAIDRVFAKSLALSPAEARDNWLLTRIARDGMVRYITKQGDFRDLGATLDASYGDEFYEVLEDPWAPYSEKFLALDDRLSEMKTPASAKMWEKIAGELGQLNAKADVFGRVGAYMAQTIETTFGRNRLVEILGQGPRAFYDAYQSTRPGALMSFRLPMDTSTKVAH